ncbi:zeta toxin family protein [Pedobacter sp. Leaf194]|uniref:zeta toxin family protein n=1 Tax=Pedobacter sp. Leaf194 TaxID=1736297 RepID=UPI0007030F3D|nr:zeta toxin family protein [Pedobacter sp. Leaf194]KQS32459.1 hypothetical protein ASG14_16370 [Pedobacter sp. Leaf194]
MDQLEELREKFRLSDREKAILSEIIIGDFTKNIKAEEKPVAIILGGQPGSGKSELTTAALKMLKGNAVICNADEYRDYHPKAEEIKENHEEFYPELTVDYSQPWNNELRAYCEGHKLNFILETTFSSGQRMNDTIKQIKAKGYQVYLLVLSVNEQLSFLGTRI